MNESTSAIVKCPGCGANNRIPREKIGSSARCGKCRMTLDTTAAQEGAAGSYTIRCLKCSRLEASHRTEKVPRAGHRHPLLPLSRAAPLRPREEPPLRDPLRGQGRRGAHRDPQRHFLGVAQLQGIPFQPLAAMRVFRPAPPYADNPRLPDDPRPPPAHEKVAVTPARRGRPRRNPG